MQNSYECISQVWSKYPKEFNNLSLCDDKIKLQNLFEEKKVYFEDYLTKIIIIGDVSAGKSTLINSLLENNYFETTCGNATVAFYYCCQSEKGYEYFTINDDREVTDMDLLRNTRGLTAYVPDYINHCTIFKVYIKNDLNKLLQKKTVIVDCPGFGHSDECNKKINYHCSTADIIIFIFDYKTPATPKQRNCINDIRKTYRNPACFFVYNKCDEEEFDDQKLKSLKEEFIETFSKVYHEGDKLGNDTLYFISARNRDARKDFERLNTDLVTHKNVNVIRYLNVRSILSEAINNFKESIRSFISLQEREKTDLHEKQIQMNNESNYLNRAYSNLQDFVRNLINDLSKEFQKELILSALFTSLKDYTGTCTKHDAYPFILNLANFIDTEICVQLNTLLDKKAISIINYKIKDMKKENTTELNVIENIQFNLEKHFSFMVTDMNVSMFWPHEKGDKTKKVKKAYITYIQTTKISDKITEKILKFYNDKLSKIEAYVLESIQFSKSKNVEKINQFNEDFLNKVNLIGSLEEYEINVKKFIQNYNSSLY